MFGTERTINPGYSHKIWGNKNKGCTRTFEVLLVPTMTSRVNAIGMQIETTRQRMFKMDRVVEGSGGVKMQGRE